MPVLKLPVVHKFGIISHTQRLQLQSRLVDDITTGGLDKTIPVRKGNPFEVNDEFVERYNAALKHVDANSSDLKAVDDLANKMFMKLKRRIGLQHNCEDAVHLNLSLGWTELTILSQCAGPFGEKCVELILLSLNVAPFTSGTFSVLFYILESSLYFLQTNELNPSSMNKHFKWLQVAELAVLRIYVSCKLGLAKCTKDKIQNLEIYIKDYKKYLSQFKDYPEVLISFCVVDEVFQYMLKNFEESSTEMSGNEIWEHKKSTLLWHSVDIWKCCFYPSCQSELDDAISGVERCLQNDSSFGTWIDCYLAIKVLANSATFSSVGLDIFLSLFQGLSDYNSVVEKERSNKAENLIPSEMEEAESNEIACDVEKGTLLLLTCVREFATIPLICRTSLERERSLSVLAEILLQKNDSVSLTEYAEMIVISRLKATFDIVSKAPTSSPLVVIQNSIWSLLEAIGRRRKMNMESNKCFHYGKMLVSTLTSDEISENTKLINCRLAQILVDFLLPLGAHSAIPEIPKPQRPVAKSDLKINKWKVDQCQMSSVKSRQKKVTADYIRKSDAKLKNIVQNYWDQGLPGLARKIDEEQTKSTTPEGPRVNQ